VHPDYRRRGLAAGMVSKTCEYLSRRGYKALFCHIEDWNAPSIRMFNACGFERVGTVRYLRITWAAFFRIDLRWTVPSALPAWLQKQMTSFEAPLGGGS
jgi:RimJ/RimL family protein N-acetyltransferase